MNAEHSYMITPQHIARWYMATADAREATYYENNVHDYGYRLTYQQAAEQVGVPEPWRDLVVTMLMAGYVEFYDWAQAQLD